MPTIVTGVAGYIGAHVADSLLNNNERVIGLDDFSTGFPSFVDPRVEFYKVDISDSDQLWTNLRKYKGEKLSLIHIAGVKYAGLSVYEPLRFYRANTVGVVNMLEICSSLEIGEIVFSSSCSVYGNTGGLLPISENQERLPISPYGRSKLFGEEIIQDFSEATNKKAVALRYFNVAGNASIPAFDVSPYNLFPNLYRSIQEKKKFKVFGNSFNTPDGTCIRDYVDVVLLAEAHVTALTELRRGKELNFSYNLGSGNGISVNQIMQTARELIDENLEVEFVSARAGDPASILADTTLAKRDLNWEDSASIDHQLLSGWKAWNTNNL